MNNKIFYFTGTGNSLQVSNDIANAIGNSEVIPLAKYDTSNEITAERIGIVFPIYFWGLPQIVVNFLENMKLKDDAYVFAIGTYGIWPGKALEEAKGLLNQRNVTLNSGFFIKMPDNYILWYGAKDEKLQNKCFEQEHIKINLISKTILSKQTIALEKSKYLFDRLFTNPIHKSNVKKSARVDEKFSADQKCVSCRLCEKICPVNNITLIKGKPTWNHHCEVCLACIQRCPMQAINYDNKSQNRKRYINPNVTL